MPESRDRDHKDYVGYPVARGAGGYADVFGKSKEEFISYLESKKNVLDIGAGGGVFYKEVKLLSEKGEVSPDLRIVPFDIIYGTERGTEFAEYATHLAFDNLNLQADREAIRDLDKLFAKDAVGGSFVDLPFADESFDLAIACYSFGVHSRNKDQLMKALKETKRVLKSGGEAWISVGYELESKRLYSGRNRFYYSLEELRMVLGTADIKLENTVTRKGLRAWFLVMKK